MASGDAQEDLLTKKVQRSVDESSPLIGRVNQKQAIPKLLDCVSEEAIPELIMDMFWPRSLVSTLKMPILVESSSDPNLTSVDNDRAST